MTLNLVSGVVENGAIIVDIDDFDTDDHRAGLGRVSAVTGYHDYLVAKITTKMAIKFTAHAQRRRQGSAEVQLSNPPKRHKHTLKLHSICQFGQLILRKIIKTVAIRSHISKL